MNEQGKKIESRTRLKKALRLIGDVLFIVVAALAMFVLVISVTSKKDPDGTATVFGYQLRFVQSDSMEKSELTDVSGYKIKSIRVKSCVFVEVAPTSETEKAEWYKGLRVGDVLTFKYVYARQETITHRIVRIEEKETGGYLITLEGDNKTSETNLLSQTIDTTLSDSPNYIIGKVRGQSYVLGLLVYALKSPVGIVCFIIVPALIVIIFEILRLVRVFGAEKREKQKQERESQANEIEELKRRLEELQNQATNRNPTEETPTATNATDSETESQTEGEKKETEEEKKKEEEENG